MADGLFYLDAKEPFVASDIGTVTLAATAKALYPAANFPVLGTRYFDRVGKKMRIKLAGRIVTGATPGNGQLVVYWGTGADANGTALASTLAVALSASRPSDVWEAEIDVTCRALGSSGALLVTGKFMASPLVLASTLQPLMLGQTGIAPAQVTVDLTASSIVSVQFLRSGATAETMTVHDMSVIALN
jgi:hypothetical protein